MAEDDLDLGLAYEAAFKDAPVAMWCYDIESLHFLAANRQAVARFGWSADEFRQMVVTDLVDPDELSALEDGPPLTVDDPNPRRLQWRFRTRDGAKVDVATVSHAIDFGGLPARMVLVNDITRELEVEAQRQQALDAARASERRLQVLLENSSEVVTIISPTDEVLFLSHSRRSELMRDGPDPEASAFGYIHPDSLGRAAEMQQQAIDNPGVHLGPTELRVVMPDGEERWVETSWIGLSDDPAIGGVVSHTRDITERLQAVAAQRRDEERFRLLVEESDEAIMVVSNDLERVYLSPNAERFFGLPREEVATIGIEQVHPEDQHAFLAAIDASRIGTSRVEARMWIRDEWRLLDMSLRDLTDQPSVGGLVVNIRDVTSQRRVEQQYVRAQKMEAFGRLVGGVAHDFNNLLTTVMGNASLLLDVLAPGSAEQEQAEAILQSGARGAELTRQLLAVTRHQRIEPQEVDLNRSVRDLLPLIRPNIGDDVRLDLDLRPGALTVRIDPGRLDQVLLDLVGNAVEAVTGGGRVTIRTRVDGHGPDDRRAVLDVVDDGIGMDQGVFDHLFEPFFSTKVDAPGAGLGLATAYAIVDQAGGSIDVTSAVGVGTTLRIVLALVDGGAPGDGRSGDDDGAPVDGRVRDATSERVDGGSSGAATAGPVAWPRGSRVLLVEDDALVRNLTAHALEEAGFEVVEADSVEGGAGVAADRGASIDVVVTDVMLGDGLASQLVELLQQSCPDAPVLYISGYALDTMVTGGEVAPGVAFLSKPFLADDLIRHVNDLFVSRSR